ncbi:MAG: hypothetical protein NXI20_22425 [bacterium]|nr:hypothetical protein [bacterium]
MKPQHLIQAFLAAIVITLLLFLFELASGNTLSNHEFIWNLLANFFIVCVLSLYVTQSRYHSIRLLLSTTAIFYVIGTFNIIVEALLFKVVSLSYFMKSMLFGLPYALVVSVIVIWVFGRWKGGNESTQGFLPRKVGSWVGKILIANFIYIFFYLIAGVLIQNSTPGFSEFYQDKLPPLEVFFMTNVFFRGFVFVAIAILIDRSIDANKLNKALLVGMVFSIIGGVAPLIPPNESMPQFIRVAHGIEVGISNFLYGISVLLIVRSKHKDSEVSMG